MCKNVTMAEEYLADHFPGFPVLPGVLMLEAAIQAAAWLVRTTEGFQHSLIVLKEARGARYGTFVAPGQTLVMEAQATEITPTRSLFTITGLNQGAKAIAAKLELAHLNLADTDAAMKAVDDSMIQAQKERWGTLIGAATIPGTAAR